MNAIKLRSVSKCYPLYRSPADRFRELATLNRLRRHADFWALHDISFEIGRGEAFCIIGQNGSGKSTLLQILAGVLQPTAGERKVSGRVAALLELGSGFNPEFTGRDNVYLNASILGLSNSEIDGRYSAIAAFADIGRFLDQPVKTYSSGMVVRLAFAIAIHVDPEILIVDEALAVGDQYFRQRCMRKISEMRQRSVTIVFVSHSMSDVKAIGDRTLWIDRGAMRDIGDTDLVVSKYVAAADSNGHRSIADTRAFSGRVSSGGNDAEILDFSLTDTTGAPVLMLEPSTELVARIAVRASCDIARPRIGFVMRNHVGLDFASFETDSGPMHSGQVLTVELHIDLPHLYPAHFSFSPYVSDAAAESGTMCDWIDNAVTLEVARRERPVYGYIHVPCRVEVNARLHPQ